MPIDIDPQPNERVFVNVRYQASSRSVPFAIGITDHAVYVPAKKLWARDDPWYIKRVPIVQVRQVIVKRSRTIGILLLAALMFGGGLFVLYFMLDPIIHGQGGKVSGWPLAITIGGMLLPAVARGRRSLHIIFTDGKYSWTPPLVVDKASREYIRQLLDHIIGGFRSAGLPVTE